jgi:hypothetical protein
MEADEFLTASGPLATLRHWQEAGGAWRVVGGRAGDVTVALCRCDGGEEVDRLHIDDPQAVAYLRRRPSSEE